MRRHDYAVTFDQPRYFNTLIWSTPMLVLSTFALILYIIPTQDQHQSSNSLYWTCELLVCFVVREGLWQSSCTPSLVTNTILLPQIQQNHSTLMDTVMRCSYTISSNFVRLIILKQYPVCQYNQFHHNDTDWSADGLQAASQDTNVESGMHCVTGHERLWTMWTMWWCGGIRVCLWF